VEIAPGPPWRSLIENDNSPQGDHGGWREQRRTDRRMPTGN
jgi:hypothetical protein